VNLKSLKTMPANIWILGLAAMFTDTSSEMIHCVLPMFLVSTLGTSLTTVGVIEGLAESVASITKLFSGMLSDRMHERRPLVIAGYGLSTLMKPLFALAQNAGWVVAARTGDRIGKGIRGAPRDAMVADSIAPENRGAAYGLRQSLDTLGACLGPAIAFVIISGNATDFRTVFWVAVVPGVLAVFTLIFGLKEPPKTHSGSAKPPIDWRTVPDLGSKFWIIFWSAFVFNLGNSSDAFLLLRAQNVGIANSLIPLTVILMNVTYAASAYPFGSLSDKFSKIKLLAAAFVLNAAVYAGFGFAGTAWHIWILFGIYGLYLGMSQGVLSAMVADCVPKDRRGTAFGLIALATGVTLLPASIIAGALWDKVSPAATFLTGSGFALAATVILLLLLRQPKDS